jgi:uncharacterized protein YchJ
MKVEIYSKEVTQAGLADNFAESINEDFKQSILRHVEKVNIMKQEGQRIIAAEHQSKLAEQKSAKVVGRNDPCMCGSGKKYKKCCG